MSGVSGLCADLAHNLVLYINLNQVSLMFKANDTSKKSSVYLEKEELESRIQKLTSFIDSSPAINRISKEERQRQLCQLNAMKKYRESLQERIEITEIKENPHAL